MKKFMHYFLFTFMFLGTISIYAATAPVTVNTNDSNGNPIAAKFKVWKGPNYVGEFNTNSSTQLDVGSTYKLFAHYNLSSTERKEFTVSPSGNTFNFTTTNVSAPNFTGGYHDYRGAGSWKSLTLSGTELFPYDYNGGTMRFQFAVGPWNNKTWASFEYDFAGENSLVLELNEVRTLVWDDRDGDGIQDNNEPGIEGASVELLKTNNTVYGTATTDANGEALLLTHLNKAKLKYTKKDFRLCLYASR